MRGLIEDTVRLQCFTYADIRLNAHDGSGVCAAQGMATMSVSYLIEAVRDEQVVERGTAWFLEAQTVVTAFHVVGEKHSGEWLSTKLPAL